MGDCGCHLDVYRCNTHEDDVVFVMSRADADRTEVALMSAATGLRSVPRRAEAAEALRSFRCSVTPATGGGP